MSNLPENVIEDVLMTDREIQLCMETLKKIRESKQKCEKIQEKIRGNNQAVNKSIGRIEQCYERLEETIQEMEWLTGSLERINDNQNDNQNNTTFYELFFLVSTTLVLLL